MQSRRCNGPLAQLVEQKTFNLLVDGSNPSRPTIAINDLKRPCGAFFIASVIPSVIHRSYCTQQGTEIRRVDGMAFLKLLARGMLGPAIVFGTACSVIALTKVLGDQCWAPRVGGVFVGLSVFAQGLLFARPELGRRKMTSGLTVEQQVMHFVYVASLFGTLLWALGDFVTVLWGVEICRK